MKMTSTLLLKHWKNDRIAVYVPKETILKEMTTKIKLSQHFFFDLDDHISEVQNNLDRQINTNAGPILYRLSDRIPSPAEFQAISNIYLFISPVGSVIEATKSIKHTHISQSIVSFCC
jgi:hypothetical protein